MHENEILVLLLGSVVFGFVIRYQKRLKRLPTYKVLLSAFIAVYIAWLATNLEHLAFPQFFNYLEHIGYFANGMLLLTWCYLGMKNGFHHEHH